MNNRRYMPTLAELLDRLSICQLKEWLIPEHRKEYEKEIEDIEHDIDLLLEEQKVKLDARSLRALVVLSQINREIWLNEGNWRKGIREGNNLELTHGLNSIRNHAKNIIQEKVGGRLDYKLDNVEAFPQWVPSWKKTSSVKRVSTDEGNVEYYFLEPLDIIIIGDEEDVGEAMTSIWKEVPYKDIGNLVGMREIRRKK